MSILGNPITLGGGGADLNIDFGSTPPTDTSKLWVPLGKKPSNISLQTGVDVGDFAVQTIDIVDVNGNISAIPTYSGIADDGSGGWYCFGGGGASAQYGPHTTKAIQHISNAGVIEQISETLIYGTASPWCVRSGQYIYIFGGAKSDNSYNNIGRPMIQRFNVQTKQAEYIWSDETLSYTSSAGGPWNDGSKLFKRGNYIILASGNYQVNDLPGSYGQGDNMMRFFNTTDNSFVRKQITPGAHNIYGTKICAITDKLAVAAYYLDSSNTGYKYNLDTYAVELNAPTIPANKTSIANNNSVPFYYYGKSYVIAADGKIYEYNSVTNSFSSTPIKQITTELNARSFKWCYNDGRIYMPYSSKLYICDVKTPLANNNMIIALDIQGAVWKALNTKDTQASVYPIKVLVGDATGYAETKDAYLYDNATSKWTKLDGSSTYQDMLNALNIMGVN